MIYLDNAATTPVRPEALQAAWPWLTNEFGNPSSTHEPGLRAKAALEDARARVAKFFNAKTSEIVFTSGGTESINQAIIGLALANPRGKHLVSSRTEHQAVLASIDFLEREHGFETTWLQLDSAGNILNFADALRNDTTLVTLMTVNNEIGTVHPIGELATAAHEVGALFHTDAVQAVGWQDLDVHALNIDALSVSGHKFGAPKGCGVLYLKNRIQLEPLIHGGGQEHVLRSGTQNVAWAVAIATALELVPTTDEEIAEVCRIRDQFISYVLSAIPQAGLTGDAIKRNANIASFVFDGINGETLLLELERKGIVVSSGSACAAGSDEPSHVLLAIGVDPDLAQTAVRFSFTHATTEHDLQLAAQALQECVAKFQ
jgi:cysteine desulfurase